MGQDYYSVRTGRQTGSIELDFEELKRLFSSTFSKLEDQGYFAEAFGQECVDTGPTIGTLGSDIGLAFTIKLQKRDLWPIFNTIDGYSEADLFSVIELLHDYVSRPDYSYYHSWNNCGNHYGKFDSEGGKSEFAKEINEMLLLYTPKFELSQDGRILEVSPTGLEPLVAAPPPLFDPDNVDTRIQLAIEKFRHFSSSDDERKDAVRTLADVLEYLRPKMKGIIPSKDEADLFNIANNFAIRHHNQGQQGDYDVALWYQWIFYTYLATIHLILGKLAERT